jgi:hypothetical protein
MGKIVYRSEGPLRDSENTTRLGNRWVSEYFHYSSGPATDLRSAYWGNPDIRASIGSFGRYCVVLKISETSKSIRTAPLPAFAPLTVSGKRS